MQSLRPLFLLLSLTLSSAALARPDVVLLKPEEIQKLIGDFPAQGSQAEFRDDEVLLEWQTKRTQGDCDFAASQENVSIKTMFGGSRGPLTEAELKSLPLSITIKAAAEIGANALIAKKLFNRPRPFQRNSQIVPCIDRPKSSAYPSGHTTYAYAMAWLLAKRFPLKTFSLLKSAEQASMNRVIGGVHHPSDIVAGKKLGEEIAKRMILD